MGWVGRLSGALLFCFVPLTWAADPTPERPVAILQLQVVEGEGGVHAANSKASQPITVRATDETGRPLAGAAVSFHLPADGPGGVFASGLRTEVVTTGPDGRASVWSIRWNASTGAFPLRITAIKDNVRAGLVSQQYLADFAAAQPSRTNRAAVQPSGRRGRWLPMTLIVAGAVGGGVAAGMLRGASGTASSAAARPTPVGPPQIGNPTITIGGPR